jgi:hypothetical protein
MDPGPFGALVVGFSVYYFALALVRAIVGDPLVALSGGDRAGRRWGRQRRSLAIIGAVALLLVGAVAVPAGSVRLELAMLAAATPVLLLHDGYRYLCWATRRPRLVVVLDGAWLVVSLAVFAGAVAVVGIDSVSGRLVLGAWCLGGVMATLLGRRLVSPISSVDGGSSDVGPDVGSEEARAGRSLGRTQAILAVDTNGLPVVAAALAGPTVSAGLRAATLPFMPLSTVIAAMRMMALPKLRAAVIEDRARATTAKVTLAFAAIAAGTCGAILGLLGLVPVQWLGSTGRLVEPWFAAAAVIVAARVINLPLSDVLSLGADQQRVVHYRLGTTAIDWGATLAGAILLGVGGAITARALSATLSVGIWTVAVARATSRPVAWTGQPLGSDGAHSSASGLHS